jgi:hypothetical protein
MQLYSNMVRWCSVFAPPFGYGRRMRLRRYLPFTFFLLVLWTAIALPEAKAQNLVADLRAFKKAWSQADLGRRLQAIGFSQDLVEKSRR